MPDIDSYIGLMHTLFTLEDLYGLTVSESDEDICLKVDTSKDKDAHELWKMLQFGGYYRFTVKLHWPAAQRRARLSAPRYTEISSCHLTFERQPVRIWQPALRTSGR